MKITYLGHAGFCVETSSTIIIMDPWLSPHGAFDAAWFQYPQNHYMADYVRNLLDNSTKDKYLYISHDHHDHFDIEFIKTLRNRDFTIVLANFAHPVVKPILEANHYECKNIISLSDNEELHFKDGLLTLFILDMELDCDSAILVKSESECFLNLNDCKIYERLSDINSKYGPINLFTAQFSGAVWHPICYQMEPKKYEVITNNKNKRKLDLIAKGIETLKPTLFIPSAGPPCFLDPLLLHLNFAEVSVFQRVPQLINFLDTHFKNTDVPTRWSEVMPGDQIDLQTSSFIHNYEKVKDSDFKEYVLNYAKQYEQFFAKRAAKNALIDPKKVFLDLKPILEEKLALMKAVRRNLPTYLYWAISDYPNEMYCIDFQKNTITQVTAIAHSTNYYYISSPGWQVNKVLTGEMTWADFALCFRVTLKREPDIYNTLTQGFLILEGIHLERFCNLFYEVYSKKERINVVVKGKTYSVLRYCPHQGGDLLQGWVEDCFLICPRHQWRFDLEHEGVCRYNQATIDAKLVDEGSNNSSSTKIDKLSNDTSKE